MAALSAIAPEPDVHQRARGIGRVVTQSRNGSTELTELYQDGCAKIRLPHTHDASLQAVLMNTAGGLCGGDDLRWEANAAPGTNLVLTTPACERVYRSLGTDARVTNQLAVGAGAHLDWLPQETILFEGARLHRTLDVDLAEGASLCAIEAILLGREAMGEAARGALLSDDWRIRRNGKLIHAEATRLSADPLERDGISLLDGALAFASVLYVGNAAERKHAAVQTRMAGRSGASLVGERLIVRVLAESGLALRRIIAPIIAELSGAGALPRLWNI